MPASEPRDWPRGLPNHDDLHKKVYLTHSQDNAYDVQIIGMFMYWVMNHNRGYVECASYQ